jgi:ribulose-5-phosphate 4-epimerase/fuculose-1-phosphate aldolase
MTTVDEAKSLICDLCATFYAQGWVSGTGGGISVKSVDGRIVMAPSGVQKERMLPSDMFVLDGATGAVVEEPVARPPPYRPPKLSECSPLFMAVRPLRPHTTLLLVGQADHFTRPQNKKLTTQQPKKKKKNQKNTPK